MLKQISSQAELDTLLTENEHVLVYFWAAWNSPCTVLGGFLKEFDADPGMKLYIAKVNADEHQDIADKYDVHSVPTILLFKNGTPVLTKNIVGVPPKAMLHDKLIQLMAA